MNLPDIEEVADKTRQGVKWSFSLQIIQKIFFFLSSIILARLLSPSDFGLSTMSFTLDTITWMFLSLGINSAVMYYQDHIEERLNTAFWLYLASSVFFVIVQILMAPLVAHFYKEPLLIPIIRVNAISILFLSLGFAQKTILSKNLDFKKISIIDSLISLARMILYVIFALAGFRVWSFIYPKLIIAVISLIFLWNITPWRPKLKFHFPYWLEMLNYGKNVFFSNIIDYVINNSSYILIGSLLGPDSLGMYTFAYDKSMMIVNNIAYPFTAVSFPAFARLQNHRDKLKNVFLKTMQMISLIAFPYAFCQMVIGPDYINVVFGHKWQSAIILFQIILAYSIIRSAIQGGGAVLEGTGNPHINLRWNMIFAPIYISSIYIGFNLGGILGIGIATSITGVLGSLVYMAMVFKVLNWHLKEAYIVLKPALFSSIITMYTLFIARLILKYSHASDICILLILIPFSVLVYALSIKLLFKDTFAFIIDNLIKLLGNNIKWLNNFKENF